MPRQTRAAAKATGLDDEQAELQVGSPYSLHSGEEGLGDESRAGTMKSKKKNKAHASKRNKDLNDSPGAPNVAALEHQELAREEARGEAEGTSLRTIDEEASREVVCEMHLPLIEHEADT